MTRERRSRGAAVLVAGLLVAILPGGCGGERLELTVLSPNGGETWVAGTTETVTWTWAWGPVTIELSTDGGASWTTLASDVSNDGEETVTVPDTPSAECRVRIVAVYGGGSDVSDADFAIGRSGGPGVWHVSVDAAGQAHDGRTWTTAFLHPQDGVDAASAGEEVWVAEGTYARRGSGDTVLLTMKSGVAIYGGFAGTELLRGERDWTAHVATLDGEGNVYHVVVGASDATLDGFTVTGANASGSGSDDDGGGMYNSFVTNLAVANCVFSGNAASSGGGGMYDEYSSSTVTGCSFPGNSADWSGGAMYERYSSSTVTDCSFSGNSADWSGGAIYNGYSDTAVTDCTFLSNLATNNGGGMCNEDFSSPTVTNCTFSANTAGYDGGGMYNYGSSSPTVADCTFSSNTASSTGGGMCNWDSSPTVTNCTFSGNTASNCGGGMYDFGPSSPTVAGCTFSGNAASCGAGMYNSSSSPTVTNCTFSANSADWLGGGMHNYAPSSPTVTNCTFSTNSAPQGGGGMYSKDSSPTIIECSFSRNTASQGHGGGMNNYGSSSPTVTDCTFSGNAASHDGGGMFNDHSSAVINCMFSDNVAGRDGGAMYFIGSAATLTSCTSSGNTAAERGGGMFSRLFASPAVANCIFWGNYARTGPEVSDDGTGSCTLSYSDVQGCGGSGAGWDASVGVDGGGNIDSDPLFVNVPVRTDLAATDGTTTTVEITDADINYAVNDVIELDDDGMARTVSDVTATTVTFAPALAAASTPGMLVQNWGPGATDLDLDLHLSGGSPCTDTGTDVGAPDHDLDGNPRPSGSYYDMGAYEYW